MSILVQISVLPRQQEDEPFIKELALTKAKLYANDISQLRILKRSIDAIRLPIKINLQVEFLLQNEQIETIPSFISHDFSIKK